MLKKALKEVALVLEEVDRQRELRGDSDFGASLVAQVLRPHLETLEADFYADPPAIPPGRIRR